MASTSTTKPERPAYEVKIAKTRDEVEACFDIRVEGTLSYHEHEHIADWIVFHVEQVQAQVLK